MSKGSIGVTSENIFPIIKKFLYSDHDIFIREIVSNAVDAVQKLKVLSRAGEYNGNIDDLKIEVKIDKKKKTLTVSDQGLGLTAQGVEKYINQIAFSGADEFLKKHQDDAQSIIGHFGLGFYSSFMVSDTVEIVSLSHEEGAEAVHWTCNGSPEYTIEKAEKKEVGTDVIMHINDESTEFLEDSRIENLLKKYCRFLPIPIVFGKEKEWKDGKEVETDKPNQINETNPLWTRQPSELKAEDYSSFYKELYPMGNDPLFQIHLNIDYPFNLTGVLYFPKISNQLELQRDKIGLYCNQVFVTDHVEGIVPEYLTLLHGVIDSPDIPLNVSRSYLQSDANVKKISTYITRKVVDKLKELFKQDRSSYEAKWDDLGMFIEYGMLSDEKFYDKSSEFYLYKNIEGKYYTLDEYEKLVATDQTDKDGNLVFLYADDIEKQHSFIEEAKAKGYDVLLMNTHLAVPLLNHLEQKLEKKNFKRIDADVLSRLIPKADEDDKVHVSEEEKEQISTFFQGLLPKEESNFIVELDSLGKEAAPVVITQNEFMRRMKEMSKFQQAGGMNFYGQMPDSYNFVINTSHPLFEKIRTDVASLVPEDAKGVKKELTELESKVKAKEGEGAKEDDTDLQQMKSELSDKQMAYKSAIETAAQDSELFKRVLNIALLSNNMLKGESLTKFIKDSYRHLL